MPIERIKLRRKGKQFDRRIKATVLQSLVKIRLDDAVTLLKTGIQDRRNGALYLAGYAVECAIKAKICSEQNTEWLDDKYFLHDLQRLTENTLVWTKIKGDVKVFGLLLNLSERWSVVWRYQRQVITEREVVQFINRAREFHSWLLQN